MLTLTRKNRLAAFVDPHEPSVRFSRPSTVYTRSCFVPPSFKSGSQPTMDAPSSIEITARNTSVAFVGLRPATWHSYTLLSTFAAVANVEILDLSIT